MKKLIILASFLALYSTGAQSATLQQQIDSHVKETVKSLDERSKRDATDSDYFRYAQTGKQEIISSDVNHDGIQDKIVVLDFCEKTNCHLTTTSTKVLVFTGMKNKQFKYLGSQSFSVYATVQKDKKGNITVHQYDYFDEDPHCCPSRITRFNLAIAQGKPVFKKLK